jgi:polyisoprenoid-binding protein YceI
MRAAVRRALASRRRGTFAPAAFALAALAITATAPRADAPIAHYTADAAHSRLEFTGIQAGAPFTAVFHAFTAAIDFAPDALAGAHFDVLIDLGSVDSMDKDRDTTMRGPDVFDIAHYPTAHYVTRAFTKTAAGFEAGGTLTLHGVSREVPIAFSFADAGGGGAKLTGTAKLQRLDFGVGRGDWKNTDWVKNEVDIHFALALVPKR